MNFVYRRLATAALFAIGFFLAMSHRTDADGDPRAPATFAAEDPRNRGLDANLYMQTAGEYRACCLQAYNLGAARLKTLLENKKPGGMPPAVIMDLDETVFDNSGFMTSQTRSGLGYDNRLWGLWESGHADHVGIIPGAKQFILDARKSGVTVFFISNRSCALVAQAKQALTRLGIAPSDDKQIKLSSGNDDKTPRMDEVRAEFDVLLYFGDNLRDFSDTFKFGDVSQATGDQLDSAIEQRKAAVDGQAAKWADRWIILPNPSYGEWMRPLNRGAQDYGRLRPVAK